MTGPVVRPDPHPRRFSAGVQFAAALPNLIAAVMFLWVWKSPVGWREPMVPALVLVVLTELLMLFATFLFGVWAAQEMPLRKRFLSLGGWTLFFGIFVIDPGWQFRSVSPAITLGGLVLSHLLPVWTGQRIPDGERMMQVAATTLRAVWFVVAVVLGAVIPWPSGGVTHDISYYGVEVSRYGGGAWGEEPHLALATGVLYYGMLALARYLFHGQEGVRVHDRNGGSDTGDRFLYSGGTNGACESC
jgi:hypothetical protein